MLFDTHCHLDNPQLSVRLPEILREAAASGVDRFVVPGVHPDGWEGIWEVAKASRAVAPAFGIHPMHADLCDHENLMRLNRLADAAVAIGEIGLDYLLPLPREIQEKAFRDQLRIAVARRLPVLIHCRRAFPDLLAILRDEGVEECGGVMHAFSGSPEMARECLKLGLYISFSGSVTFTNAVRPVAVAGMVPHDRILLETDAPDLAPEPHRGETNRPAYLVHTARRLAEIIGISYADLAHITSENALRLFTRISA